MVSYMQNAYLNYKMVLYHHGWATKYGICGSSEVKILSRDGDWDNSLDYITVWITMQSYLRSRELIAIERNWDVDARREKKKRGIRNSALCARRDTKREIHLLPLMRYSNDQDCRTCNASRINFRLKISHTLHSQFFFPSLSVYILVGFSITRAFLFPKISFLIFTCLF